MKVHLGNYRSYLLTHATVTRDTVGAYAGGF